MSWVASPRACRSGRRRSCHRARRLPQSPTPGLSSRVSLSWPPVVTSAPRRALPRRSRSIPETTGDTTPEGEPVEEELGNDTTFTLEVTPEQAERIAYATENGSIWLTLVPGDFVEVETTGVTTLNLFGGNLLDDIFGN